MRWHRALRNLDRRITTGPTFGLPPGLLIMPSCVEKMAVRSVLEELLLLSWEVRMFRFAHWVPFDPFCHSSGLFTYLLNWSSIFGGKRIRHPSSKRCIEIGFCLTWPSVCCSCTIKVPSSPVIF